MSFNDTIMENPDSILFKYKKPLDKPDGTQIGGAASMVVGITVPAEKERKIREQLQEKVNAKAKKRGIRNPPKVEIGKLHYTKGTVNLAIVGKDGAFVEKIHNAGRPSLFGDNVAAFLIEFTPEGATFFEQTFSGTSGSAMVTVEYVLYFNAKLPPLRIRGWFHASAFYSFVQTVKVDERLCRADSYKESLSEVIRRSESKGVIVDPSESGAAIDPKVLKELRNWANQSVDDAVERLMIQQLPIEDPEEARKWYKENDIENVRRSVMRSQVSDYSFNYTEYAVIEKNWNPVVPLPPIPTLKDNKGKNLAWKDYFAEVDADDPFFRTLNVGVQVNAPFDDLPIHSVEVKLAYKGKPMNVLGSEMEGEFRFSSPNDIAVFASYIEDNDWKYTYSYQVNYLNASKTFQSDKIVADDSQLTINIDEVGVLLVEIGPGDLNFDQVKQVQLTMRYEDTSNGIDLIEQQFILDGDNAYHRFQDIIYTKRSKPYTYRCKYFMTDGKEYLGDWKTGESNNLYVNDPFSSTEVISARAIGDLDNDIENIFVDFKYEDQGNDYIQTTSIVLNNRQHFFDWKFPVIDESAGVITYSGSIVYRDGTISQISETVAQSKTPMIGEKIQDLMTIEVLAYLIDFVSTVRMARIQLKYTDIDNGIVERKDFIFAGNREMEQSWSLKLADKDKIDFEWTATYYMTDGTKVTDGPHQSEELSLVLDVPVTV